MIRLWHKKRTHPYAAQVASREAEDRYREALDRWEEVNKVTAPIKKAREQNHFADLFKAFGGGPQ